MFIDIIKHLLLKKAKEKEAIDRAFSENPNVVPFRPGNPKSEEIESHVQDILKNGVPLTETNHVASAIIYLYFDRLIWMSTEEWKTLTQEIAFGGLSPTVLQAISQITPACYEYLVERIRDRDCGSTTYTDYAAYYLLQKKMGDMAARGIDRASEWVEHNRNDYRCHWLFGSFMLHWSVWLPSESVPHEDPKFRHQYYTMHHQLHDLDRRKKDPIYGGRPHEVLHETRPHLVNSFDWWNLQLFFLLDSKYRNEPAYQKVALEVGKKCIALFPFAHGEAEAKTATQGYVGRSALTENKALPRYIKLLEGLGQAQEAIAVCDSCLEYKIHDGTTWGFEGRRESLQRRYEKQQPELRGSGGGKRGRKAKLTDEQVLDVVHRYLSATSKGRKALAEQYGITASHLAYLVSKNRGRVEGCP